MEIKFGTDGWRDVIAESYTFENVHQVARGAALYFKKLPNASSGVMVGYDARFLSREFAELTARVLAAEGLKVLIAKSVVSTPATSLTIVKKKLCGGVMITASHNPAKYNGFKIKGEYGGSALPDAIAKIEAATNSDANRSRTSKDFHSGQIASFEQFQKEGRITEVDAKAIYVKELARLVKLDRIKRSKIKIAYDPMYGAGVGNLETLLPSAVILHDVWNPGFGNTRPEPLADTTKELAKLIVEQGFDIGLITDGDADRIGAIDENGEFFSSQMILCLLLKYLVEVRRQKGMVVVSESVTSMVEKMCTNYGLKLQRTPVGFKYITEYMLKGGVLIGGEESGGIGIPSLHIPERDGLFNGLLLCEICGHYKKPLGVLVAELEKQYGPHKYDRFDYHTTDEHKKQVLDRAKKGFSEIAGLKVLKTSSLDGFKYSLDKGAWLMIRASGTEPLLRYYAEAPSTALVKKLLAFAKSL
ncbi:MAG: phosphoglucomutase/phosphomannomutase family protein [Bacteroidota bacterium]|nr:phosphoglucomutase/phosphomannomutase family protein [Bacteroidota bacterium]MDP4232741.1 phosphoglucomutase/phosphomannomutase family protein [Bacteroidota bacterium]MDP4244057.1 phosphoglucomutase/phosphomannomutase family protein [Bacteroidota bacterium]MDP4287583.1 phosphoglucomutase/phosphomannomutase family protein [Bacteroidota bacterium]